jgi:hypothetical protein
MLRSCRSLVIREGQVVAVLGSLRRTLSRNNGSLTDVA